jgi:hypothetical protein
MADGGAQGHEFNYGTDAASGTIYFYAAGTSNAKNAWSDEDKSTAITSLTLDTRGIGFAYLDGDYKIVVKDSDAVTLYTRDSWKFTSDTSTMWEGNFDTSYPTAGAANKHHMFALVDGSDDLNALGVNNGSAFQDIAYPVGKGTDIASAASITIPWDGNYFDVTGTTGITAIAASRAGRIVYLHYDGVLTITHHATSLILPGGNNITTYAGLELAFEEYSSGNWRLVGGVNTKLTIDDFTLATHGHADAAGGGNLGQVQATDITLTGSAASPPDSNTLVKDNIPKGWVRFNGTGAPTILDDYNAVSITDNGVGIYDVVWNTDLANTSYCAVTSCDSGWARPGTLAVGTTQVICRSNDTTAAYDSAAVHCVVFGDQ